MAGRPKTPSNVLRMNGAYKNHPERENKAEPVVTTPFPKTAPKHLDAKAKKTWAEIVSITPAGVLTGSDTIIVETIAVLLAEFRAWKPNETNKFKLYPTERLTRMTSEMGKIGLTPSSRAGLKVERKQKNKFSDI